MGTTDNENNALRARRTEIKNNILSDEPEESKSMISQLRLSNIYNLVKVFGGLVIQFWMMIITMVITNVYGFIFKREKSVKNENVLITGSGGFLGRSLAHDFAKRGANLILWDIDETANKKTVEFLKLKNLTKAEIFTVDLSDEISLKNTAKLVKEKYGHVSMVIMAAAPRTAPQSIMDINYKKDAVKHFEISYVSQLILIQEFLQSMINRDNGHFVTISSACAVLDVPLVSVYSSFKSAQSKLLETLREELRLNCIQNVNTSVVYLDQLEGGLAKDFEDVFQIPNSSSSFLNIDTAADIITTGILRNKSIIFAPASHRILFFFKYLISPKITGFMFSKFVKVNENKFKLKPKIY